MPLMIINDGDVTALAGAMSLKKDGMLGMAMGSSEAAGFLQSRKIENGYKLEMLAELTRILPEDTYLDRLSMHQGTTQMQGKSGNAQSLIELINDSDQFDNASFRGPTRLDNRSGKEIFDLTADNTTKDAD